jgi:2-keto-3-deoxy-L-arabinonate dehydratase
MSGPNLSVAERRAVRRVSGLVPIVATPFDEQGYLDEESLRAEVDYLVRAGVDGITLFGVAGEGYAVTDAERERGVRVAVEQARGRVAVIAGTGHTGTEVAAYLSARAADAGADAVMVIMPYFIRPDAAGVRAYCAAVADAAGVPVMVQDQPHTTGVMLPVPLLVEMARDLPLVSLFKIETPAPVGKIAQLAAALREHAPDAAVLGGAAGVHLLEELAVGSQGTMPASLMPEVYGAVWRAYRDGEVERARALFERYFPLIRLTNQPGMGPRLVKLLLQRAGIIRTTYTRGPAPAVDAATERVLLETAERLDLWAIMAGKASPAV